MGWHPRPPPGPAPADHQMEEVFYEANLQRQQSVQTHINCSDRPQTGMACKHLYLLFVGQIQYISFRVTGLWWQITQNDKCSICLCAFSKRDTQHFICPTHRLPPSSPPPPSLSALYLSAIRQIVAGLICIMSPTVPTGAPHSCLLKDSGATAPSHSPIPWIKLTLGQHQHIMNYGHLPLQTHCSLCSNVKNIEGTGELARWQLIRSLISSVVRACEKWTAGLHWDARVWIILSPWVTFPVAWPLPRIQMFLRSILLVLFFNNTVQKPKFRWTL